MVSKDLFFDISILLFLSCGQVAINCFLRNYWDKNEMVCGSVNGTTREQFWLKSYAQTQ